MVKLAASKPTLLQKAQQQQTQKKE
jgi:rRNA-processing protein EBP2